MCLLELLHGRHDRRLYGIGPTRRLTSRFLRSCQLALERDNPLRRATLRRPGLGESRLQLRQSAFVLAMYALRHTLERLDRFGARVVLEKPNHRQLEQRDRRPESLRRPRAEDLAGLVKHENRAQLPLESNAARGQPAHLVETAQSEQSGKFIDALCELDELSSRDHCHSLPIRQVIDRRLERRDVHLGAARNETLAEHAASVVVADIQMPGLDGLQLLRGPAPKGR